MAPRKTPAAKAAPDPEAKPSALALFLGRFRSGRNPDMLHAVLDNDERAVIGAGIVGPSRAMFYATIAHETGEFQRFEENLNYTSAERIFAVFGPRYFPGGVPEATRFIKRPEKLANRVYGGRMGNGPEASGDGWLYRGRGLVQLTGRDNYTALNIDKRPDLASDPRHALNVAASWWLANITPSHVQSGFVAVSRRVNGGENGMDHRTAVFQWALADGLARTP